MKKVSLILILAVVMCFTATSVMADGPYPDKLANDTYGIAQGGAANGTPTARDNNDNLLGLPNPADQNDAVNILASTLFARNKDIDHLYHSGPHNTWKAITDGGGAKSTGTFVVVSRTALFANLLSIYDQDSPATTPVIAPVSGFGFTGDGSIGDPFDAAKFVPYADFGWTLANKDNTWDSNVGNNALGYDHLMVFNLSTLLKGKSIYIDTGSGAELFSFSSSVYMLGWEDKPCLEKLNGDFDCGDNDYDDLIILADGVKPITPEPLSLALFGSGLVGLIGARRRKRS